ncbi:mitogen-activated protein kinase kinase [Thraustotheca clavata]|uniref:Mitogen-activated protein kinase kinase n=1 Tax=Thraustotheca clavata TaxID=74557 RepID=A0A1V9Y843_9STRA|nr:mitogen-activated protein kinase kinase [Thraustotheca clavata]
MNRGDREDTCLYGSVDKGLVAHLELLDDSEDEEEFVTYPTNLSPVAWTMYSGSPSSTTTSEPTPREKLRERRRCRSESASTTASITPTASGKAIEHAMCDECEGNLGEVYCQDCDLVYCSSCNDARHRKGKLVLHERTALSPKNPEAVSPLKVKTTYSFVSPAKPVFSIENNDKTQSTSVASPAKLLSPKEKKQIPTSEWTSEQVKNWLKKIDLKVYLEAFTSIGMNGPKLLGLTQDDLDRWDQLIFASRAQKKKLWREISKLKPASVVPAPIVIPSQEEFQRRKSDVTSPVAALRARVHQGQSEKGRLARRQTTSNTFVKPTLNLCQDAPSPKPAAAPAYAKRRPTVELGLDLNKHGDRHLDASFDFTAEGRLQTHGFDINTEGITKTPFQPSTKKPTLFGTKDSLVILNELGHGASGKVFKALYLPTFKLVAVKVIRVYDQKKRHQMLRELKSLYANFVSLNETRAAAACDELVMFYDAYTNPEIGCVSIVLEYMDGGSLEDIMKSGCPCSEDQIANIATSVLRGLAFLHEHHQLHRDIKLSNILVSQNGAVKISDFGISTELENTLAKATTFTGTLLYMAPERISGGTYSYPSDVWSFGLALMACAIGRLPVPTEDGYWGVVHAIQEQPSPRLRDFGDFSPELCDFIDLCLKKDPMHRPPAAELLNHPFLKYYESSSPILNTSSPSDVHAELQKIANAVEGWMATHDRSRLASLMDDPTMRKKALHGLARQLQVDYQSVETMFSFF